MGHLIDRGYARCDGEGCKRPLSRVRAPNAKYCPDCRARQGIPHPCPCGCRTDGVVMVGARLYCAATAAILTSDAAL